MNITTSSNLEIVVAGVENDTNIVDVGVEVVEKLSVINVGQLITGLDKTKSCIVAKSENDFFTVKKCLHMLFIAVAFSIHTSIMSGWSPSGKYDSNNRPLADM